MTSRFKQRQERMKEEEEEERKRMRIALDAVQNILDYQFRNEKLLEKALIHSSQSDSDQFERLEFLGDAALGIAVSDYLFRSRRSGGPQVLHDERKELVGNRKLAEVNVDNDLFRYVRHNPGMDAEILYYINGRNSGAEPNKFLADMVEAIAGALYVDSGYNSKILWKHFGRLICGEIAAEPETNGKKSWLRDLIIFVIIAIAIGAFFSPSDHRSRLAS